MKVPYSFSADLLINKSSKWLHFASLCLDLNPFEYSQRQQLWEIEPIYLHPFSDFLFLSFPHGGRL